jgi:hypothetical protein
MGQPYDRMPRAASAAAARRLTACPRASRIHGMGAESRVRRGAYRLTVVAHDAALPGVEERLGPGDLARLASADSAGVARLLAGRSAVLLAAAGWTGSPVEALRVDAACPVCGGPHGRPLATGARRPVHVSVAHAAGRAFAVAADVPVGIDAEPRSTSSARRRAVRDLLARGSATPLADWTRVEAILKADGRGLRVDPREVALGAGGHRGRVLDLDPDYRVRVRRDLHSCVVAVARAIPSAALSGPESVGAPGGAARHRTPRRAGRP